MKLGLSSFSFPWAVGMPGHYPAHPLGVSDLLTKAHKLKVDTVQIGDNLPLERLPPWEITEISKKAKELRLEIELGTSGVDADHLGIYIQLAHELGASLIRATPDVADRKAGIDELAAALKNHLDDLEKTGIKVAIENTGRFSSEDLTRLVEMTGSNQVGICFDTGNCYATLEGWEQCLNCFAGHILNVHVKDYSVIRLPYLLGFMVEGRPAGQGQLNIPKLLDKLGSEKASPNIILELWTPPEKMLSATIIKEEAWANTSIEYLRKMLDSKIRQPSADT